MGGSPVMFDLGVMRHYFAQLQQVNIFAATTCCASSGPPEIPVLELENVPPFLGKTPQTLFSIGAYNSHHTC